MLHLSTEERPYEDPAVAESALVSVGSSSGMGLSLCMVLPGAVLVTILHGKSEETLCHEYKAYKMYYVHQT